MSAVFVLVVWLMLDDNVYFCVTALFYERQTGLQRKRSICTGRHISHSANFLSSVFNDVVCC